MTTPEQIHKAIMAGGVDAEALRVAVAAMTPAERAAALERELETAKALLPELDAALRAAFPIPTPHLGYACLMTAAALLQVPGVPLPREAFVLLAALVFDAVAPGG